MTDKPAETMLSRAAKAVEEQSKIMSGAEADVFWLHIAKAALEAIREPSEAMKNAVSNKRCIFQSCSQPVAMGWYEEYGSIHTDMIDAILNEEA